jgi:hypothetical protein
LVTFPRAGHQYDQFDTPTNLPFAIAHFRHHHWGIETGFHYHRDVTLKEDALWMTIGNMEKVMAFINNFVLSLIRQAKFKNGAQARRLFTTHIFVAFTLLATLFSRS